MLGLRSILLFVVAVLRYVVNVVGFALAVAFIALFAFEFFHAPKIETSVVYARVAHLLAPSIKFLSSWFGWAWPRGASPNFAPAILAVAVIFVRGFVEGLLLRLDYLARRKGKAKRRQLGAPGSGPVLAANRYAPTAATEQQRAALLKRFRQIEDSLRSQEKKTCVFVSIDVVGSTKMKIGERASAIAATFQAYEEMVKAAFADYGMWKATWTPDGVMAAFLDRDLALAAVQHILRSLQQFNAEENQLRTPFTIRCGMNEGDVVIYDDSALEKVSDHAIDVAGHMQKYAAPDALWISDVLYEKLGSPAEFSPTKNEVDGFNTYAWTPPLEEAART